MITYIYKCIYPLRYEKAHRRYAKIPFQQSSQRKKEIHKEMIIRIQNHSLICQTMNHYNQQLGTLGSNIQNRNSPFQPSSWLHPNTGTKFQTTPASNPIRLQWIDNCFCYTKPIRKSERPLHPFINSHRLSQKIFICLHLSLYVNTYI
jgi:hypothetical protein